MKTLLLKAVLLTVSVVAVESAASMGWRGSSDPNLNTVAELPYDVRNEVTFEGKIKRIDPAPCVALPISSYHVHLVLDDKPVEIHLGPCWFLANQKMVLHEGDRVSGFGSIASTPSKERKVIVAREIHRGKETIRLRDATGKGLWR